jgi:glycosyltransferase involved in cell wall biosynthesis
VVIPEAVPLATFKFQEKPFGGNLGILCRLTPRKRVYELILAFYELNQKVDGFKLHIGGGPHMRFGDYYEAMERLVSDLKLQDRVIFYGNVTDASQWYSNIDIFISNSYSEGLQVSPMEAVASGCYCLAHRWAGADELLPDENLYFTDHELINKILDYAQAPLEDQKARRQSLVSRVQDCFDMEKVKIQVRSVVEEVGRGATH